MLKLVQNEEFGNEVEVGTGEEAGALGVRGPKPVLFVPPITNEADGGTRRRADKLPERSEPVTNKPKLLNCSILFLGADSTMS